MKGKVSSDCFTFVCKEINLHVINIILQYQHKVPSTAVTNAAYKYGLHVLDGCHATGFVRGR